MIEAFIPIVLLFAAYRTCSGKIFSPLFLSAAFLFLTAVGVWIGMNYMGWPSGAFWVLIVGWFFMVVGYGIHSHRHPVKHDPEKSCDIKLPYPVLIPRMIIVAFSLPLIILVIIFFSQNGIPLFSGDVYHERLAVMAQKGAGFFVRPMLFLLPFMALLSFVLIKTSDTTFDKVMFAVVFSFALLVRVLIGYKSGAAEVIATFLIYFSITSKMRSKWILLMLVFFFGSMLAITSVHYGTDLFASGEKLLERATLSAGTGIHVLIDEYLYSGGETFYGKSFASELFAWKYGAVEVPFTLGITLPGFLYMHYGWVGLCIFSLGAGYLISYFYKQLKIYRYDPLMAAFYTALISNIVFVINRGHLFQALTYHFISLIVIVVVTAIALTVLFSSYRKGQVLPLLKLKNRE